MMFATRSGIRYRYDIRTHLIERADSEDTEEYPVTLVFDEVPVASSLPNMDTFIIELTRRCNLRCSYCCYSGKYPDHRIHQCLSMDEARLREVFWFMDSHRVKERTLNVSFYGGEALLEWDLLRRMLPEARGIFPEDTEYTVSTNGVLLKRQLVEWCVTNGIYLNISLDGTLAIHDRNRVFPDGSGSYHLVYENLERIHKEYPDYFVSHINLLLTLESTVDLLPIALAWEADPLLREKAPYLIAGISPIYPKDVHFFEGYEERIVKDLYRMLDYYKLHPDAVFVRAYFEQLVNPVLERDIYELPDKLTSLVCLPYNVRCFIDVEGMIGVCEKMCDKFRIGTIDQGFDWEEVNRMMSAFGKERQRRCHSCWAQRLCLSCLTDLAYEEGLWDQDCIRQKSWIRIALLFMCELAEEGLV